MIGYAVTTEHPNLLRSEVLHHKLKRIFIEEDYRKYNKKRSLREIEKRHRLNKKTLAYPWKNRQPDKNVWIPKYKLKDKARNIDKIRKRHSLTIPSVFSITEATDENLSFFDLLFHHIQNGDKIFLDMENIEIMTPDALLYILSIFEYFELRNFKMDIKGNFPKNEQALELLIQSDFFKYVMSVNIPESNENVLKIKKGIKTDPIIVKEVIDFTLKHLNQNITQRSKVIYRILIEMMANTVEHAYRISSNTSRWYLMASRETGNGKIRFAFLDGGFGMPSTIRKNFSDKVETILLSITGTSNDSRLIMSALNGKFRTRTNKGYRGKGLRCSRSNAWSRPYDSIPIQG